jgi:hypothetical protein
MSKRKSSTELLSESDKLLRDIDSILIAERVERVLQSAAPGCKGHSEYDEWIARVLGMELRDYMYVCDVREAHTDECWPECYNTQYPVDSLGNLESRSYLNNAFGEYTPQYYSRNNYEAWQFTLRDQERLSHERPSGPRLERTGRTTPCEDELQGRVDVFTRDVPPYPSLPRWYRDMFVRRVEPTEEVLAHNEGEGA